MCTCLGLKDKNAMWDGTPPSCTQQLVKIGGKVLTDDKSLKRIELSQLVPRFIAISVICHTMGVGGWLGRCPLCTITRACWTF